MLKNSIEAALLVEGLSSKTQEFYHLIKNTLKIKPMDILKKLIGRKVMESVLDIDIIILEASAPRGAMREIARCATHRAVEMRFKTSDQNDYFLYFVVPLKNAAGEEISDKRTKTSIETRLNEIYNDIKNNVENAEMELHAVFKTKEGVLAQLREIGEVISAADVDPQQLLAKDPARNTMAQLFMKYYPDRARALIGSLAVMKPGELENNLSKFTWAGGSVPMFTRAAATIVANVPDKLRHRPDIKKEIEARVAEVALAVAAASQLEATETQ